MTIETVCVCMCVRECVWLRAVRKFNAQPSSSLGVWPCDSCSRVCSSRIGIFAHQKTHWRQSICCSRWHSPVCDCVCMCCKKFVRIIWVLLLMNVKLLQIFAVVDVMVSCLSCPYYTHLSQVCNYVVCRCISMLWYIHTVYVPPLYPCCHGGQGSVLLWSRSLLRYRYWSFGACSEKCCSNSQRFKVFSCLLCHCKPFRI